MVELIRYKLYDWNYMFGLPVCGEKANKQTKRFSLALGSTDILQIIQFNMCKYIAFHVFITNHWTQSDTSPIMYYHEMCHPQHPVAWSPLATRQSQRLAPGSPDYFAATPFPC